VISSQEHLCEQHMSWRWKWLGYVARLTHVMKEFIAYETWHGVMWLRWRRSRQGLAWWTGCKCEGQVEWWLGTDGPKQWWRASEVKIDEPIQSRDDMKWIISFVIGWCMCCINIGGDGMECARQRYTHRVFYFTGHRCVEKFMTEFRIDGCTIKRNKLVCISVI
jgi:hypothetical protein